MTMPASRMKTEVFQGADCVVDKEVSRMKKRCRFGSEVPDEHYMKLFEMLLGSCDSEMGQDEDDPTYITFLEKLRERGNSYNLDVPSEHGMTFPLKYEDEDDPPDELKRKTPKSRSCILNSDQVSGAENFGPLKEDTLFEKRSSLHVDWELKSGVKDSDSRKTNTQMRSLKIVENSTNSWQKNPVSKPSAKAGCPSRQDHRSNSKAHLAGNSYGVFISNVKVNRQSIFYKHRDGKLVYYETRGQHKSNNVQKKPSKTVPIKKGRASRSPNLTPAPSQPTFTVTEPAQMHAHTSREPTAKDGRDGSDKPSKRASTTLSLTSRPITPTLRAAFTRIPAAKDCRNGSDKPSKRASTTQIPTLRPTTPTPRAPTSKPTPVPRTPTAKGCHDVSDKPPKRGSTTQIRTSRPTTRSPTLRPPTSSSISIPSTSVIKDRHLHNSNSNSNFNSQSTFSNALDKEKDAIQRSRALFRKKLQNSCTMPYEQREYEDLLEKVSVRKPIIVHKETRGRDYTKEGEMGKSYLDIYPDLHKEIKKVQSDPNKVLNLLRGFFLYLQHIPNGIPTPWKIDPLRAIMLGNPPRGSL